jgi:hypothetical protein
VLLVRSVYFNLWNILPKSGTFLPGHPVYISVAVAITNCTWFINLPEILPGVKKPARENHQLPTNHAEVKKAWKNTSISTVYISVHTATRIKTFASVQQLEMNFDHRRQSLRSLYRLPTKVERWQK